MDLDMDIDNDSDEDFDPCDKELIEGYLMNKISNRPVPTNNIQDVDITKHTPEDLAERSKWQGRKNNALYFFTPRHRHFPLSLRRVRGAGEGGYWKISGRTSKIYGKDGNVGLQEALPAFIEEAQW
ncbi:hypothetical protein IFM89_007512 [Coptis chinensis]|uniref:NAC domain-containing protein n=1 Tax=Coptis chinensis TaxID=261450 RepID=A0A835M2B4_9MAGN|nr:hypothetical protein IFM89_007512 [Coptis chinensis]